MQPASTPLALSPGRHVLGSFLSAVAGWLALTLGQYIRCLFQPENTGDWWPLYPIFCTPFILVVWLVVLLPLYLRVPASSALWRWPVCTVGGVMAGTIIALVVWCVLDLHSVTERFIDFLDASLWLGGVCGGATCLFGSLTAPAFRCGVSFAPALDRAKEGKKRMVAWLKAKFLASAGQ